ncbi:hypothetical protein HOJ36_02750 [Candidatus Woesearchaeota archaeon]|nr:hypothetical protein [Candidatus Woesearchaeota archaeon]
MKNRFVLGLIIFVLMVMAMASTYAAVYCGGAYDDSDPGGDWTINSSITCSDETIHVTGELSIVSFSETEGSEFAESTNYYDLRSHSSTINAAIPDLVKDESEYTSNWESLKYYNDRNQSFHILMNESEHRLKIYANTTLGYIIDIDNNGDTGDIGGDMVFGFHPEISVDIFGCWNASAGEKGDFAILVMGNESTSGSYSCLTSLTEADANFTVYYNKSSNHIWEIVIDIDGAWSNKYIINLMTEGYTTFRNSPISAGNIGNLTLNNINLSYENNFTINNGGIFIVNNSNITFNTPNSNMEFRINEGASVLINNSYLQSNNSYNYSFYVSASDFTISNSYLDNLCIGCGSGIGYGGGIYLDGDGGTINSVSFGDNIEGSAISILGDGVTVSNSDLSLHNFQIKRGGKSNPGNNIVKNNHINDIIIVDTFGELFYNNTIYRQIVGQGVNHTYHDITFWNNKLDTAKIIDANNTHYNLFIYNNSFGEIKWNHNNFTIPTNLDLKIGINIYVEDNNLGFNADESNLINFNTSANLTFLGLAYASQPFLLKNGVRCDNTDDCNITNYNGGVLNANVIGFSNYTTQSSANGQYCNGEYNDSTWNVTTALSCSDETINVTGWVNITGTGSLTLDNVTLNVDENLYVTMDGGFLATDSNITFRLTNNGSSNFTLDGTSYLNLTRTDLGSNDSNLYWGWAVGIGKYNITYGNISNSGFDQGGLCGEFNADGGFIHGNTFSNAHPTCNGNIKIRGSSVGMNMSSNTFTDSTFNVYFDGNAGRGVSVENNIFTGPVYVDAMTDSNINFTSNTFNYAGGFALALQGRTEDLILKNNDFTQLSQISDENTTALNTVIYSNANGEIKFQNYNALAFANSLVLDDNIFIESNNLGLDMNASLAPLNESANLTFHNLASVTQPELHKNGVRCDDGNDCNITSYAGGTLTANVKGFSNYTTVGDAGVTCGDINTDTTLTADLNASGTCFNITANSITLDCNGYTINYSQSALGYGVNNTGFTDVTIRDCIIIEGSTTGSQHGVYLEGASTNNIINNTINTSGADSYGVYIYANSNTNNISQNNVTTTGMADGIRLEASKFANLTENTVVTTAATSYTIEGENINHTNHTIDTSNKAEGLPVVYNHSVTSQTMPETGDLSGIYGQLICANCQDITYNGPITLAKDGIYITGGNNVTLSTFTIDSVTGPALSFINVTDITLPGGSLFGNSGDIASNPMVLFKNSNNGVIGSGATSLSMISNNQNAILKLVSSTGLSFTNIGIQTFGANQKAIQLVDSSNNSFTDPSFQMNMNRIQLFGDNNIGFSLETDTGTTQNNVIHNANVWHGGGVVNPISISDLSGASYNQYVLNSSMGGEMYWNLTNLTNSFNSTFNVMGMGSDPFVLANNLIGLDYTTSTADKVGGLNGTARIRFDMLTNPDTPALLKDLVRCDDSDICNITSYDGSIVTYTMYANIASFSTYQTADITSPRISNVSNISITGEGARILSTSHELTTANVTYSVNPDLSSSSFLASNQASLTPLVTLSGLLPNTIYYYNVTNCDKALPVPNCVTNGTYSFLTRGFYDIEVAILTPVTAADKNFSANTSTQFTVNVTCKDTSTFNCGALNVSLDPEVSGGDPVPCAANLVKDCRFLDSGTCTGGGCAWVGNDCIVFKGQGCGGLNAESCSSGYECFSSEGENECKNCGFSGICTPAATCVVAVADPTNKGGLINTTIGATPFFTNDTNPTVVASLNKGESTTVSWWVNATGNVTNKYTFYVYVNGTNVGSNDFAYNVSEIINITIDEASSGPTISSLSEQGQSGTTATVVVVTDVATNASLNYGTTDALGNIVNNATLLTTHAFPLTDLTPGNVYHYNMTVCDASEACITQEDEFFTYTYGQSTETCWSFAGNQASCESTADTLDCVWTDAGTNGCPEAGGGCCDTAGCWMYDGDKTTCQAATTLGCSWTDNQYNQNSWCPTSSSNPYTPEGTFVSGVNIGCCSQPGCWDSDGTSQGVCEASNFMGGICKWKTQAQDPMCTDATGCCMLPFCDEADSQEDCNFLTSNGQPCTWSGEACINQGFGGFSGADSCQASDGFWNGTDCEMPTYNGGEADIKCWFADNSPNVCTNVTGCLYCDANNTAVSESICEGAQVGWCNGHQSNAGLENLPTDAVECLDINVKSACDCGPVPGCNWNSSSLTTGAYCSNGVSNCNIDYNSLEYQECSDAPDQSSCEQLKTDYLMPCKFNSDTSACEFDWQSGGGFGDSKGNLDFSFNDIMDENSCQFSGGIWKTVTTDSYGNTDGWCEFGFGAGTENCSNACWACEQQDTGEAWANLAAAQSACENSAAGGSDCQFVTFGGTQQPDGKWGWCDNPAAMSFFGGGNCDDSCFNCFNDAMCSGSGASCTWVNDPMGFGPGWCDPAALAAANVCNATNALPCMGQDNCENNGHNWTNEYASDPFSGQGMWVCIVNGTTPELCFVPGDEDSDGLDGCSDDDCSMDPMCGFGMGFEGGFGTMGGMMLPPGTEQEICYSYDDVNQSACEATVVDYEFSYNGSHRGNTSLPVHMNETQVCYWHAAPESASESFWCDPMMDQQMKGNFDMSKPPEGIGEDEANDAPATPPGGSNIGVNAVNDHLDIIKVTLMNNPQNMDVGVAMTDLTGSAICNNKLGGTSNATIYRYLDTDNNASSGCPATNGTYDGFDYKLVVQALYNGSSVTKTTAAFRCTDSDADTWTTMSATLTPMEEGCFATPSPGSPDFGTFNGIGVLMFTKADFGISTANLRLFVATVANDFNETVPTDEAGPFYYTPGSFDFMKEDCFGFVDADGDGSLPSQDDDCKFINNLGYIPAEVCDDNLDNNGDGLTDCDDPLCAFKPTGGCGGMLDFTASGTDTTAPSVIFHNADTFHDGAFIKFDTNEPANGTITFYHNDSTCYNVNTTIYDIGDPYCNGDWCAYDDYKLWHEGFIDNFDGSYYALGYNLSVSTNYYYKYKVCDPDGNCAVSACSNFTTEASEPSFQFDMNAPSGFTVKTPWATEGQDYATNINVSDAKNINITVDCSDSGYSMKFVNADIKSAKNVDFTGFVCEGSSNLIGMNSSVWDQLLFDLSPDFVEISWAITTSGTTIQHCDIDGVTNCVDVTTYLDCVSSATTLTCKVPNTLGFSAYKAVTPGSSSPAASPGTGGGSDDYPTAEEEVEEEVEDEGPSLQEVLASWENQASDDEEEEVEEEEEVVIIEEELTAEDEEEPEVIIAEEEDSDTVGQAFTKLFGGRKGSSSFVGLTAILFVLGALFYLIRKEEKIKHHEE